MQQHLYDNESITTQTIIEERTAIDHQDLSIKTKLYNRDLRLKHVFPLAHLTYRSITHS